jgi:hypothetical protein
MNKPKLNNMKPIKKNRLSHKFTFLFLFFVSIIFVVGCSEDDNNQEVKEDIDVQVLTRHEVLPIIPFDCSGETSQLTVSIDDCLSNSVYEQGINNAIEAYNAIPGSSVHFTIVENNADINFDCAGDQCDPVEGVVGASAQEFFDEDPSTNTIFLNVLTLEMATCCNMQGQIFGQCNINAIIMQELGHVLGLGFTGSGNFPLIPGTPEIDPNSIFNEESLCSGNCEFTAGDILAIQTLHPEVTATVEGTEVLCLGEVGQFCLSLGNVGFYGDIRWSTGGGLVLPSEPLGLKREYCHEFSSLTPGEHTIRAWITQGTCTFSVKTTVTVSEFRRL